MKLTSLGPNLTVVTVVGTDVLFSYSTPVAAFIPGEGLLKSAKKHSPTTSGHVNKWLDGRNAEERPQEFFDGLLET